MKKLILLTLLLIGNYSFSQKIQTQTSCSGNGTANQGSYTYEANLSASSYLPGMKDVRYKLALNNYKITSFTYKGINASTITGVNFPIYIDRIQAKVNFSLEYYSNNLSQKFSNLTMLGVQQGQGDYGDLSSSQIGSLKNRFNIKEKSDFYNLNLRISSCKISKTYFEELSKIKILIDNKIQNESYGEKQHSVNNTSDQQDNNDSTSRTNNSSTQQTENKTTEQQDSKPQTLSEKKDKLQELVNSGKSNSREADALRNEIYYEETAIQDAIDKENNKPITITDSEAQVLAEGVMMLGNGIGAIASMDFGNKDKRFEIRLAYGFRNLISPYEDGEKFTSWAFYPELEYTGDLGKNLFLDVHAQYLNFNFKGYGVLGDIKGDAKLTEIPLSVGVHFNNLFSLGTTFRYSSVKQDYDQYRNSEFNPYEPTFGEKVNYGLYFALEKRLYKKFFLKAKVTHLFANLKKFDLDNTAATTMFSLQAGIGLLHAGANYQTTSVSGVANPFSYDISEPSLDIYLGLRLPL